MSNERYFGSVVWFTAKLGYGFIACAQLEKEIFVHFSNIDMTGFRTLADGQQVEFSIGEKDGKQQAVDVKPLTNEGSESHGNQGHRVQA